MRLFPASFLVAALVVGVVGAASAQQTGGISLRGNNTLNVNAQDVNTVATGQNTVAKTNIGAINSSHSGGSTVSVDAKNVQNVVGGRGRKGCVNIGVTGADPDCK
ncbi:MAG: hypothetical protein HY985_08095 [Magnetospirillum sp.]|nr:hypothetical protein [Magnetospirillum sp.]